MFTIIVYYFLYKNPMSSAERIVYGETNEVSIPLNEETYAV